MAPWLLMVTTRGGKTLEVEKQEARSCQTEIKELGVRTRYSASGVFIYMLRYLERKPVTIELRCIVPFLE